MHGQGKIQEKPSNTTTLAPNITLGEILRGSLPYVGCMVVGIVLLCLMPEIALWLPDTLMGPGR